MFGVLSAGALGAAASAGVLILRASRQRTARVRAAQHEAARALEAVTQEHARSLDEAREQASALEANLAADLTSHEEQLQSDEEHVARLEQSLARQLSQVESRDEALASRYDALGERKGSLKAGQAQLEAISMEALQTLEDAAGASREEVALTLREAMATEARLEANRHAKAAIARVEADVETEARRLLDLVTQRYGQAVSVNRLTGTVQLPKPAAREALLAEDRAVLRALEETLGVEYQASGEEHLYIQAPEPYLREMGRLAYDRLVRGGQLTAPVARKVAEKTRKDLATMARDAGNRAARILKVKGVDKRLLMEVGKLLFRTSYTQNQWQHAVETAHFAGMMAQNLGVDPRAARRAGLLHDIGKVMWAETEAVGSHAVSGAAYALECGESEAICHAIRAHHDDEEPKTPLARIIAAADAVSGGRPGARRETLEAYTRRVEALQGICEAFPSIRKSYVIQGGRELRIEVNPRQVSDASADELATRIARQVEEELVYPGQIKVMVIREIRAGAVARH